MKSWLLTLVSAVAVAVLLAACAGQPKREPPFDAKSPLEPMEQFAYGRSIAARVSVGRDLEVDEKAREYVAQVGGVVAASSARPDPYDGWRFYIVRDSRVATWSAPCGFVYITTGALKAAKNEDALAALLAQEMAHSALLHHLDGEPVRDIRPSRESWPYADDASRELFRDICSRGAVRATEGWSEDQEREASAWAMNALREAGYDTTGAAVPEARTARFQEQLQAVR